MGARVALCSTARSTVRPEVVRSVKYTRARSEGRDGLCYVLASARPKQTARRQWKGQKSTSPILPAIAKLMRSSPRPFAHTPCFRKQRLENHLDRRHPTRNGQPLLWVRTRPTNAAQSH